MGFNFFLLLLLISFVTNGISNAELAPNTSPTVEPSPNASPPYLLNGGEGSVQPQDCPNACTYRCSETSHRKPCMFFCIKCCTKCLCVPSGTYGHKEECPCYNEWKTQEGKPKCP